MTAHVPAIPNFLPIGPVLFGMFLGWRSHRAAVCPALGVFLLVYFTISTITGRPPANDAFGQVFYPAVTVLPPVNFIILTFLADQDFFHAGAYCVCSSFWRKLEPFTGSLYPVGRQLEPPTTADVNRIRNFVRLIDRAFICNHVSRTYRRPNGQRRRPSFHRQPFCHQRVSDCHRGDFDSGPYKERLSNLIL